MRRLAIVLVGLLAVGCLPIAPPVVEVDDGGPLVMDAPQLRDHPAQSGVVINVIDGDTIDVLIDGAEYRVRYIGIDTPERDEPCYNESTQANADYVANKKVRLVQDQSETDRFGRLLRFVYVDEVLVNAELVAGGWAESIRYRPDTVLFDFLEGLETTAVRQQRGCYAN